MDFREHTNLSIGSMIFSNAMFCQLHFVKSASYNNRLAAIITLLTVFLFSFQTPNSVLIADKGIITGAERTDAYIPMCQAKRVAIVANAASKIGDRHLVDSLLELEIEVVAILTPEHGIEGKLSAGEKVENGQYRGVPVYSLYGSTKKPTPEMLKGVQLVLFDLQDVGVRFYTYLSTLHYVMEACAEEKVDLLVLDRPNPNDGIVDGPVLDTAYRSFVGLHPVPLLYGMTIGEYACMIQGQGWINQAAQLRMHIIELLNYRRQDYRLPVAPSPNLPNHNAIRLYPHLCLFEATVISVGRGTDRPFQLLAHPYFDQHHKVVIPKSCAAAKHPKLEGQACGAVFLNHKEDILLNQLDLTLLLHYQKVFDHLGEQMIDRPEFFDKLAGSDQLRLALINGDDWMDIRRSWKQDLAAFQKVRSKYLLYPDKDDRG